MRSLTSLRCNGVTVSAFKEKDVVSEVFMFRYMLCVSLSERSAVIQASLAIMITSAIIVECATRCQNVWYMIMT